jgi:hypothetical protein
MVPELEGKEGLLVPESYRIDVLVDDTVVVEAKPWKGSAPWLVPFCSKTNA